MRNVLIVLSLLSFSASAEIILLGKSRGDAKIPQKFTISQNDLAEIKGSKIQTTDSNYTAGFSKGRIDLAQANLEVDAKGHLILKTFTVNMTMSDAQSQHTPTIKSKFPKINQPLKFDNKSYPEAYLEVTLMAPRRLDFGPLEDLGKDSETVAKNVREVMEKVLIPHEDVKDFDSNFQTLVQKMDRDWAGPWIDHRMDYADLLIKAGIVAVEDGIANASKTKDAYALLPGYIQSGYEVRTQSIGGENYSVLTKEKGAVSIPASLREMEYKSGLVALSEADAADLVKGFLSSLKQLPEGYEKGAKAGEMNYVPNKDEKSKLEAAFDVKNIETVTIHVPDIEVHFSKHAESTKVKLTLKVTVAGESKVLNGYYDISPQGGLVWNGSGEGAFDGDESLVLMTRDMKGMLKRALLPRSMVNEFGKPEASFSIKMVSPRAASFDDEEPKSGGQYLIFAK